MGLTLRTVTLQSDLEWLVFDTFNANPGSSLITDKEMITCINKTELNGSQIVSLDVTN